MGKLYIIITYIVMRRYAAIRLHAAFYHAVEKYAVNRNFYSLISNILLVNDLAII